MEKLTLEQLRTITFGTARIEQRSDGIHLCRFTAKQEEMYRQRKDEFYLKSLASAGISMEFDTDSRRLFLGVTESYGSTRDYFTFSIYANGKKIGILSGNYDPVGAGTAFEKHFNLGEGMKRVKIYFPWSACSVITDFSLDDGCRILPVRKDRTILIYGDSITHGYDALEPEKAYAVQITDRLNANAINKSIAGETFWPELAREGDPIVPEFITVAYGCNDWGRHSWQQVREDSWGFYRNLCETYPGVPIYALAPIWRSDIETKGREVPLTEVCRLFEQIAGELPQITVLDGMDYLPHDPELYSDRWIHPNDAGFQYYADGLWAKLQPLLAGK